MAYRIDLWLKHVCLYKHRSEATDECNGGKVKVNGKSTKASAVVRLGDVIEFTRGDWDRKFVVTAVPEKQLAKDTAQTAYRDESGEKPDRKDVLAKILETPTRDRGTGRPTKKRPPRAGARRLWTSGVIETTPMPYVTESPDITEEAERLQIEALRRMGPAKRIEMMRRLSKSQLEADWQALKQANPMLSERELQVKAVFLWYGEELGERLEKALKETGRWDKAPI